MRQVGVLAGAGLIALEKSPLRLHEDHENAIVLAKGIAAVEGFKLEVEVKTNILVFDCKESGLTAEEVCNELERKGVLCFPFGPFAVRMVTHWNVSREQIELAVSAIKTIKKAKN